MGGCYRMIDIPMSNCINSCINKIFVLTQFNSASLNRHLARTYFGNGINFGDGFVEVYITIWFLSKTFLCFFFFSGFDAILKVKSYCIRFWLLHKLPVKRGRSGFKEPQML